MSVASSSARPSPTRTRTPASVWIALRVEAPRTAMPSLARNVSRETVSFNVYYLTLEVVGAVDKWIRGGEPHGERRAPGDGAGDSRTAGGGHAGRPSLRFSLSTVSRTTGSA